MPSRLLPSLVVGLVVFLSLLNYGRPFLLSHPHRAWRLSPLASSRDDSRRTLGKYSNPRGRVQLDRTEGSRPLTRAELKAKEQYEASRDPYVQRQLDKNSPDRVALSSLSAGQKLKGRIISIKPFGLFVDVGSAKDGLVHIKDISKDYFVQDHTRQFSPGQEVDVWVKFADEENNKLGLQMFPNPNPTAASGPGSGAGAAVGGDAAALLAELGVGEPVEGTVVRVSRFGVFVDIGE